MSEVDRSPDNQTGAGSLDDWEAAFDLAAEPQDLSAMSVYLTPAAAGQVKKLCAAEGREALLFRVEVLGGGCSGFQYKFDLADQVNSDDVIFETDGVQLLIDPTSLPLLNGSNIDYVVQLVGSMFTVTNPNAASSCGCGTSFSIG